MKKYNNSLNIDFIINQCKEEFHIFSKDDYLYRFIEHIGGSIEYADKDKNINLTNPKYKFNICVPKKNDYRIYNYLVAKELGYILLFSNIEFDSKILNSFKGLFSFSNQNDITNVCRQFALAFLMCKEDYEEALKSSIDSYGVVDISKMSEILNTTESLVIHRGFYLGILKKKDKKDIF